MEFKCRVCEASKQNDDEKAVESQYCSGKCRVADGLEPLPKSEAEIAASVSVRVASFDDYKKHTKDYRRRIDPELLNWDGDKLNASELKQCGFRSNRTPLPGDWDFEVVEDET